MRSAFEGRRAGSFRRRQRHYVNLGAALQRQGKTDEPMKAFETYLHLAPTGELAQHAKDAITAH